MLASEAAAVSFVHDAFAHLKVIGATADAKVLLDKAGVMPDSGVVLGGDAAGYLTRAAEGRVWARELQVRTTY